MRLLQKEILIPLAIISFLIIATIIVVLYGSGYRFGISEGKPQFSGTGLLVTTSMPDGAQVFIDGHLTTATNNTLNLIPGKYNVKIYKDGYFPWEKNIKIEKEVVAKADALLFPTAPKLESITDTGVSNPVIDPSLSKIAYSVSSQSGITKNGIFVMNMENRPILTLQSAATQIVSDDADLFSTAALSWSPDGKSIIATISANRQRPSTYLLNASSFNNTPRDITATLFTFSNEWEKEKKDTDKSQINSLRAKLKKFVQENMNIIAWSPDETKLLYQATTSAQVPEIITPPIIGANTTQEERLLENNAIYVYDIKEDKNFKIQSPTSIDLLPMLSPIKWFPDSKHLVYIQNKKIVIMDYDGVNQTTIYAGPFIDHFGVPWTDGSKIVILTNFANPEIAPNLYTVSLQ